MPAGRPRAEIDWELFKRLCHIQCTKEEIAHAMGISKETLLRACKREKHENFDTLFEKESVGGKISLRRYQFETAKKGNAALLIWLGKQWLGQTDKQEVAIPQPIQVHNRIEVKQLEALFDEAAKVHATPVLSLVTGT